MHARLCWPLDSHAHPTQSAPTRRKDANDLIWLRRRAHLGVLRRRPADLRFEIADEVRLIEIPEIVGEPGAVENAAACKPRRRLLDTEASDHPLWRHADLVAKHALDRADRSTGARREIADARDRRVDLCQLDDAIRLEGLAAHTRMARANKVLDEGDPCAVAGGHDDGAVERAACALERFAECEHAIDELDRGNAGQPAGAGGPTFRAQHPAFALEAGDETARGGTADAGWVGPDDHVQTRARQGLLVEIRM